MTNSTDLVGMTTDEVLQIWPDAAPIEPLCNDDPNLEVWALDTPNDSGTCHNYIIIQKTEVYDEYGTQAGDTPYEAQGKVLAHIHFQDGPVHENGVNGVQNRQLLEICQHRLKGFAKSTRATEIYDGWNDRTLGLIESALAMEEYRTAEYIKRMEERRIVEDFRARIEGTSA